MLGVVAVGIAKVTSEYSCGMQKQPQASKGTHFILIFAFAMLPILLTVFVVPRGGQPLNQGGSTLLPIIVSCFSGSMALYFLLSKMGSDLEPEKFQTNMLVTLAFGELITLMGVFLGAPQGLPVIPFLVANYLILSLVFVKVANFWMPRR